MCLMKHQDQWIIGIIQVDNPQNLIKPGGQSVKSNTLLAMDFFPHFLLGAMSWLFQNLSGGLGILQSYGAPVIM